MSTTSYIISHHSPSRAPSIIQSRGNSKIKRGSDYIAGNDYIGLSKKIILGTLACYAPHNTEYQVSSFEKGDHRSRVKQICHWSDSIRTKSAQASAHSTFRELDQQTFDKLTLSWKEETGGASSLSKITSNPNYLKVIGFGLSAVPFILRDLQKESAPWFTALRVITGKQNVGREYAGNFQKIANAWIQWGKEAGYM